MLAVGILTLTLGYGILYVGVERFRGDKRSVLLMVMGRDAPAWPGGGLHILAN